MKSSHEALQLLSFGFFDRIEDGDRSTLNPPTVFVLKLAGQEALPNGRGIATKCLFLDGGSRASPDPLKCYGLVLGPSVEAGQTLRLQTWEYRQMTHGGSLICKECQIIDFKPNLCSLWVHADLHPIAIPTSASSNVTRPSPYHNPNAPPVEFQSPGPEKRPQNPYVQTAYNNQQRPPQDAYNNQQRPPQDAYNNRPLQDAYNNRPLQDAYNNQQRPPQDAYSSRPPQDAYGNQQTPAQNPYAQQANPYANQQRPAQDAYSNQPQDRVDSYGPVRSQSLVGGRSAEPYGAVQRRTDKNFIGIRDLSSYVPKWTIKAKVVNKSDVRNFTNAKGEGKVFTATLVDREGGEIRATFFTKAVDLFYEVLEKDSVYTFSKGRVKPANKKFRSGCAHEFELTMAEDSEIVKVDDDIGSINTPYKFVEIAQLSQKEKNDLVDVIGIVKNVGETQTIVTRATGQQRDKRELTLVDKSGMSIEVTFWAEKCSLVPPNVVDQISSGRVILLAARGLRVGEWNGRNLAVVNETSLDFDPNHLTEGRELLEWDKAGGTSRVFQPMASGVPKTDKRTTLAEIQRQTSMTSPGLTEQGVWFSVCAFIMNIETDRRWSYLGCPICSKKVSDPDESMPGAFCVNCQKHVDIPIRRYTLNVELMDHTGVLTCSALGEKGEILMRGVSASEVFEAQDRLSADGCTSLDYFHEARQECLFKILAKTQIYNDEQRIRFQINGVEPLTRPGVLEKEIERLFKFFAETPASSPTRVAAQSFQF